MKSVTAASTAFGIISFFYSDNITIILLWCIIAFIVSAIIEYSNQKNAGKIDYIIDKSEAGKTHYVLKKTYGIYDTDHCVFIYRYYEDTRYLFAIGNLYKDPLKGSFAPLYLMPIFFFDKEKRKIHINDDELSNIDYQNLFVSRWLISEAN